MSPRPLSVVHFQVDLNTMQVGHLYGFQPHQTHVNDYPNMVLIPNMCRIESAVVATVECMLFNSATEEIYLTKGEMIAYNN